MAGQERYEGLPGKKELEQLPRWAQVAFAARCAERVRPLYKHFWPDAPQKYIDAVDEAVLVAWRAASQASVPAYAAAAAVAYAAVDAIDVAAADDTAGAYGAAYAAHVAVRASAHAAAANARAANARAADAAAAADDAATHAAASGAAIAAMRRDYELLKALAEREGWTDESAVDPDLLGPLWAEGEPEGWPEMHANHDSDLQSRFRKHLESLGMKFTPERLQILDAVAEMDKPFQADELLDRMKASGSRIPKTTIHQTIELLHDEAGLLQRWIKDSGAVYYQLYYAGVVETQPEASMSPMSLYFDLDEFTPQQIAEFIRKLSELYGEIGGDELIIDDCRILEMALVPEGV